MSVSAYCEKSCKMIHFSQNFTTCVLFCNFCVAMSFSKVMENSLNTPPETAKTPAFFAVYVTFLPNVVFFVNWHTLCYDIRMWG